MYEQLISSIGSSAFAEVSEKKNKVSVSFFSQVKKAEDAHAHTHITRRLGEYLVGISHLYYIQALRMARASKFASQEFKT